MDFDIGASLQFHVSPGEHPVKDHPRMETVVLPNALDESAISKHENLHNYKQLHILHDQKSTMDRLKMSTPVKAARCCQ